MTDYDQWLAKVRAALEVTGTAGAARWIAARLGIQENTTASKLCRMMAGTLEPRGGFICAVMAWMEAGCPAVMNYQGSPGGKARAAKLSPERRREIAARANEAKQAKRAK